MKAHNALFTLSFFFRFLHRLLCSNWSQIFSALTMISGSLGCVAIPCLSPHLRISISISQRILSVKLVIKSLGLLCRPSFIFFSKIKASSFLLCRFLISFIRFLMWRLIEYLVSCTFFFKLNNLIVRHLFRFFSTCCFSFISYDNRRR